MATVDNRIVQLEFKNAEFAQAMAATLEAIKALNEALKTVGGDSGFEDVSADADRMSSRVGTAIKTAIAALPGLGAKAGEIAGRLGEAGTRAAAGLLPIGKSAEEATKKLQGISTGADFGKITDAASRVSLAPLGAAADKVSARFIALTTVAVTALSNITNRAVDAGLQITNSLSLEQVGAGFDEYELKLGSIQTIMAGTGESLETVNEYLDELNGYADRTIYSFADMTQNIGKFTNAGVSLDTSVASIQGVAQVAALSGANTNEASRAMYNFAQALSKGYVQLIDWKSIELANMGTVEFKTQLVEAAEAMGTLTKEGDKWVTEAGSEIGPKMEGFNDALTDQFLTTEVLTTTLAKYSDETTELGRRAFAASSDIKTFSQLMDVLRESIGSGFARSFEILIGDFDEAKELFTSLGDAVVGFVDRNAEARNEMLEVFKGLGGRDKLIEALGNAFKNIGEILEPIREAFRDIFPKKTAQDLFDLTQRFSDFVDRLKPSQTTVENLGRIFRGFFSAIKIGIEFFKALGRTVSDALGNLGVGSGAFLEFLAGIGDFFSGAREGLVEGEKLSGFFKSFGDVVSGSGEKLKSALSGAKEFLDKFWESVKNVGSGIKEALGNIAEQIAENIDPTGFSAAGEVVSVALLGGIAAGIAKLVKDGIEIDSSGGLFGGIGEALEELAGALSALQENLRAGAIIKIAGAIAILAAALALMALIDSAALARASGAMLGLITQLVAVTYALKAMSLGFSSLSLAATAAGLLLVAGSLLLMALAVKVMSDLDMDQLGTGLLGVAGGLGLMVLAVNNINSGGGLVRAGLAMIPMAIGLRIMASAVEAMGNLNMDQIGKGLYGIASAMTILVLAMNRMPPSMVSQAVGLVLMAAALNLIARAVEKMGSLSMDQIGKGLYTIAASLVLIGVALRLIPPTLAITAAGILLVSIALNLIAKALASFAGMTWDEIGKGLFVLAASLTLLGIAMQFMTSGLAGAAAVVIIAAGLQILAGALTAFAQLSIGQIAASLITMILALAIMGGAAALLAPLGPALLIVGAGLLLIGAGLALAGGGTAAFAKGLQVIAEVGLTAVEVLIEGIKRIIELFPVLAAAFVDSVVIIAKGLPALLEPLGELILGLLDLLIEAIPKVVETVVVFIYELITGIRELVPEFVGLGFDILMGLLNGISENIFELTNTAVDIVLGFTTALQERLPDIAAAGLMLIVGLIEGITSKIGELTLAAVELIVAFIDEVTKNLPKIIEAGVDLIIALITGIGESAGEIVTSAVETVVTFIETLGDQAQDLIDAGVQLIVDILEGIGNSVDKIVTAATDLVVTIMETMGENAGYMIEAGTQLIVDLLEGIGNSIDEIISAAVDLVITIMTTIQQESNRMADAAFTVVITFIRELRITIDERSAELRAEGARLLGAIINGMTFGISGKLSEWGRKLKNGIGGVVGGVKNFLGIGSPSKVFWEMAEWMIEGMIRPFQQDHRMEDEAVYWADQVTDSFGRALAQVPDILEGLEEFNPTITPVLDLDKVKSGVRFISELEPSVSANSAGTISSDLNSEEELVGATATVSSGVTFHQTINAPEQLSATDIYRNTRNQITLAKEELEIP